MGHHTGGETPIVGFRQFGWQCCHGHSFKKWNRNKGRGRKAADNDKWQTYERLDRQRIANLNIYLRGIKDKAGQRMSETERAKARG